MELWIICSQLVEMIPVDPCGSLPSNSALSGWMLILQTAAGFFHFIQSPQLLGYPLAFLQLGRGRGMNCFGNHILERGKKALTLSLFNCNVICGTDIRGNAGAVLHSQLLEMGFCRLGWLWGLFVLGFLGFFNYLKPACVHSVAAWDRITESWNPWGWKSPPSSSSPTFEQVNHITKCPSCLCFNISRDGDSPTSLGSLFHACPPFQCGNFPQHPISQPCSCQGDNRSTAGGFLESTVASYCLTFQWISRE